MSCRVEALLPTGEDDLLFWTICVNKRDAIAFKVVIDGTEIFFSSYEAADELRTKLKSHEKGNK